MSRLSVLITVLFVGLAVFGIGLLGRKPATPAGQIRQVGTMDHKLIRESSGIIASRRQSGVFWTHNDQGNKAALFAITREGKSLADFVVNTKNEDWEDIAIDDAGNLYVAATGNNDLEKKEVSVLRLKEPDVASRTRKKSKLEVTHAWRLAYPKAPFNCESLFVWKDCGWLITKEAEGTPATIYRFPLDEQKETLILEQVAQLKVYSPVTAADISPDGARLAVLSKEGLYVFQIDGDVASASRREARVYGSVPKQAEACCFVADGILLTAENRRIYLASEKAQ